MTDTIHLVRFRLKHGKNAADCLKANEKINEWTRLRPGFRFRSLSESDDGEWIIMVYWESLEAAQASEARFNEEMGAVVQPLIAHESIATSFSKVHTMQRG